MKNSRKLLSLLLALVMTLSLCVTAGAEETANGTWSGNLVILHTNDVHGAIDGYAAVAAVKDAYEAQGDYVLLLDAGDFSQGDPTVSDSQGATAIELMNLAGYDAAAPGNHEFDYGYANLAKLAQQAQFPILAANVLYNGKTAFDTSKIFTAPDGTKIGVFGLDTPETATKAHPAKIQGVTFLGGKSMFDCAQAQVDSLRADGCKYVICLGHLGIDAESTGNRSIDLLNAVDGIDFFVDGHSHSTMAEIAAATNKDCKVRDTLLASTGTKLANIGVIEIAKNGTYEAGSVAMSDVKTMLAEENRTPDQTVADRVAAIQKAIDDEYGAKFAETKVDLCGDKAPGNRTEETNMGDLITDALVWGAAQNGTKVDAAITNGGGIRAAIKKGDITKKDVNTVLPFGNTLSIIQITGAELLEALEASTYCTPEAVGAFPQVSGIVFTLDTAKTYDQADTTYPGSTYYGPKTINRVSIQSVGGKAFREDTVYTIATNDFTAAGGDTYYAFKAAKVNYNLGVAMDEVVMDYIKTELKGVVGEAYAKPQGRLTIVRSLPFTDVSSGDWYYDGVKYAYDNNIFSGTTATTFAPAASMTRGQMVTVLWRMAGSPETTADNPFTDVSFSSPYAKAIVWAYEHQIASGYSASAFVPNRAITREQFAAILFNYAKFQKYDVSVGESTNLLDFTDAGTVTERFVPAIQWAIGAKVLNGTSAATLTPKGTANRGQVAVILARFCQNVAPVKTA